MKQVICGSSHSRLWMLMFLDFFSKQWAYCNLDHPVRLTSFLSLDMAINRGISWSFFSSDSTTIFIAVTVVVGLFLFLLAWYTGKRRQEGYCTLGEKLVLVGGTANLLDRFYYGGVVDFIYFSYEGWSFPIFNIADICICVGVLIMVLQTVCYTSVHE